MLLISDSNVISVQENEGDANGGVSLVFVPAFNKNTQVGLKPASLLKLSCGRDYNVFETVEFILWGCYQ